MSRIVSNYARLAAGLIAGMLLVRVLLRIGPEAYGAVLVLGVATGLAISIQDFLTTGLVPVLAEAFHRRRDQHEEYGAMLSAARRLCRAAAFISFGFFITLAIVAPLMGFPVELLGAVRWFLFAKAFEWFLGVRFVPHRSLCLVAERTATLNAWVVAERFGDVIAAAMAVLWIAPDDPSRAITWYAILSACLMAFATGVATRFTSRIAGPIPEGQSQDLSPECAKRLRHAIAANSTVGVAMNLYVRAAMLIVQLTTGVLGAFLFGIAAQFSFYLRQAGMGLVLGIDGVAARAKERESSSGVAALLRRSMKWQAALVLPGAVIVFFFAKPMLTLWAGPRISDQPEDLDAICGLVRVLLLGVAARALSESWMRALTGVGHAAVVAVPVVAGAIVSPVACTVAALMAPDPWRTTAVAGAMSSVMFAVHALVLPWWTARRLRLSLADFYAPLAGPFMASLLASIAMAATSMSVPDATPLTCFGVFSLTYAFTASLIVIDTRVWRQLYHALRSRPTTP